MVYEELEPATARRRFAGIVIDLLIVQLSVFLLAVALFATGIERIIPFSPLSDATSQTLTEETHILGDGSVVDTRKYILRYQTFGLWPHAVLIESWESEDETGTYKNVRERTVDRVTLEPKGSIISSDLAFLVLPIFILLFEGLPGNLSPSRRLLGLTRLDFARHDLAKHGRDGIQIRRGQAWLRGCIKAAPFGLIAILVGFPDANRLLWPWSLAVFALPLVAFVIMLFDRRRRALHDYVAATRIVRSGSYLPAPANGL